MAKTPKDWLRRLEKLEKTSGYNSINDWSSEELLFAMRYDEPPKGRVVPNFPSDPELDNKPIEDLLHMAREDWLETFGDESMPEWMVCDELS